MLGIKFFSSVQGNYNKKIGDEERKIEKEKEEKEEESEGKIKWGKY